MYPNHNKNNKGAFTFNDFRAPPFVMKAQRLLALILLFAQLLQPSHVLAANGHVYPLFMEPEGCIRREADTNNDGVPDVIFYAPCQIQSRVRGTAFLDRNANGKRDAGEELLTFAFYKVTDGGSYFSCGYVGEDGTISVPVSPGSYIIMPIAPPGYRTTTPYIRVPAKDAAESTNHDMGFVPDQNAILETCDQYNPPRTGGNSTH